MSDAEAVTSRSSSPGERTPGASSGDEAKLEIARTEAREAGADNIDYRCQDLLSPDLVGARPPPRERHSSGTWSRVGPSRTPTTSYHAHGRRRS